MCSWPSGDSRIDAKSCRLIVASTAGGTAVGSSRERPHEAHRGELQSESETVGIAALLDDLRVIAVIEVEVPGQLLG